MKYLVKSTIEMVKVANDFSLHLLPKESSATVVGLYGDLGAGKTFFTQVIAKNLGLKEDVVSPTFVIEKKYILTNQKFANLIHIDAYRIEDSDELLSLRWREIISDPRNLILIEWPERVLDIMPEHTKVKIKHLENESEREVEIE